MYATQQEIITRYGETVLLGLADRDNDGVIDEDLLSGAITDASDLINSYLEKKYTLPLPNVPATLKRICGDIVIYLLSGDGTVTDEKRKRYEDALKFLTALSKGDASLGSDLAQSSNNTVGHVEIDSAPRIFSRNTMRGVL